MHSFMIALLTCSITMSALALFYMAITPLLSKRYCAKGCYYAWLIVIIGLVIPFRPSFDHAAIKVAVPPEMVRPIVLFGNEAPAVNPSPAASLPAFASSLSIWQILMMVWLAGALSFLVYHAIQHYRFVKLVGRWSGRVSDPAILSVLDTLKLEMGISKNIDVQLCASAGSPMMIGFFRPRILLPHIDFPPDELCFILAHELIHYKRKDLWYKALTLLATAMHWFNPIVYFATKAIDIQCELSCDSEVIRHTDVTTRLHYSEAIIGVVRYQSKMKTAFSTTFYGGKKGMKKRIFSIMDTGKKRTGIAVLCAVLLLTAGTGVAFGVNAVANAVPAEEDLLIGRSVYAGDGQFTQAEYDLLVAQQFEGYEDMTLADFNKSISQYGDEHGQVYLDAMEHVIGGIGPDDPNAAFLLNTLRASGEENACKHYQAFGAYRDPEFYGEAFKGVDEQIIDGNIYYDWEICVNYKISYRITDDSRVTVRERDQFIQDYLQSMQSFVNAKSQADWMDMTEEEIQTVVMDELNRLSGIYSNTLIQVTDVAFLGLS